MNDYLDWLHVAQVLRLGRMVWHCQYGGKTRELVYGLASLPPSRANPAKLLSLIRTYWGLENGLQYRSDVMLHEEATRLTLGTIWPSSTILSLDSVFPTASATWLTLARRKRSRSF